MSKVRTLGGVALVLSLPLLALLAWTAAASPGDQGLGEAVQDTERPGGGSANSFFPAFRSADPVVERDSPLLWAIPIGVLVLGLLALLASRWRPIELAETPPEALVGAST